MSVKLHDSTLREAVFENLYNALLGGYPEILTASTSEIATELVMYAPSMEIYEVAQLIPIIDQWEPRRNAQREAANDV